MRRNITTALTVGLIATIGFAGAQTLHAQESVYSVNVVGFQKVDVSAANQGGLGLMSMPFDKDSPYIDRVVGTNGTAGSTAFTADNVIMFDTDTQTMRTFWLFSHTNPEFDRRWRDSAGFATNVFIPPGTGYWYRNRAEDDDHTVTLVGDVVMDDEIAVPIIEGLQILSYPFSSSAVLDNMDLTNGAAGSTAFDADNVIIFDNDSGMFKTYWLFSHTNPEFDRRWRDSSGFATNVYINPGEGFWYRSRSETSFEWTASRPYDL